MDKLTVIVAGNKKVFCAMCFVRKEENKKTDFSLPSSFFFVLQRCEINVDPCIIERYLIRIAVLILCNPPFLVFVKTEANLEQVLRSGPLYYFIFTL